MLSNTVDAKVLKGNSQVILNGTKLKTPALQSTSKNDNCDYVHHHVRSARGILASICAVES